MKSLIIIPFLITLTLIHCTGNAYYRSENQTGRIRNRETSVIRGKASYYSQDFHGRRTANGEIFDMYKKTAAHRTLPFNSIIKVRNIENNKSVIVRINDRGPFHYDRILDLSYQAAKEIDMIKKGVAEIEIKIIKIGDNK
jgi:rare lipoprotein A